MPVVPPALSAIINRSMRIAQPLAQAVSEAAMMVQLRITRPGEDTYDRTTKIFTNPSDPVIYEGPGHVSDVAAGEEYNLAGEPLATTTATGQVPLSAGRIFVGDVVQLLGTPAGYTSGRFFRVTGVDVGGAIPSQQTLQLQGQAPSPQTPEL
jgi:hypothetical protein